MRAATRLDFPRMVRRDSESAHEADNTQSACGHRGHAGDYDAERALYRLAREGYLRRDPWGAHQRDDRKEAVRSTGAVAAELGFGDHARNRTGVRGFAIRMACNPMNGLAEKGPDFRFQHIKGLAG